MEPRASGLCGKHATGWAVPPVLDLVSFEQLCPKLMMSYFRVQEGSLRGLFRKKSVSMKSDGTNEYDEVRT